MPTPAIFLDRDGVINENSADYILSIPDVKFLPGVLPTLAGLATAPLALVIVTNQSVIGRGWLTRAQVDDINNYVLHHITAAGGRVTALYLCPHHPDTNCDCRKPRPGLLLQAARDLDLDLSRSTMIGDSLSDAQAGRAAGVTPALVQTGLTDLTPKRLATAGLADVPVFPDLARAIAWARARHGI